MIEKVGRDIYVPTCDCCGEELPAEYDFYDAVGAIRAAGWSIIPPKEGLTDAWEHYCPACHTRGMFDD